MAEDTQALLDLLNSLLGQEEQTGAGVQSGKTYPAPILRSIQKQSPFSLDRVEPPFLYIREEEIIEFTGWSQLPSDGFRATGTLLTVEDQLLPFTVDLNTTANQETIVRFDPSECFLLSLSISPQQKGEDPENFLGVRVRTVLIDGPFIRPQQGLLEGVMTGNRSLSFPLGSTGMQQSGQKLLKTFIINDPAPGANAFFTISLGFKFHIHCVSFFLMSGSAVANRSALITVTHQGVVYFISRAVFVQTASSTRRYTFMHQGAPEVSVGLDVIVPISSAMWMYPQDRLTIAVAGIQPGDQLVDVNITGEVALEY